MWRTYRTLHTIVDGRILCYFSRGGVDPSEEEETIARTHHLDFLYLINTIRPEGR